VAATCNLLIAHPYQRRIEAVLRRLPPLSGAPLHVHQIDGLRDRRGEVHGGAFLRERRIALNCTQRELPRILVHELFHFAWLRGGNPTRRTYEELLQAEVRAKARGELGWSSEWRKDLLQQGDWNSRSRRWREYCCESFCDSAAWVYSGIEGHAEFTLSPKVFRHRRRAWFETTIGREGLSI